jgi:anti-sigma-K factor RskA
MTQTPDTGHERWDELAAGYALHALEPTEELEFTEHLETCASCHELVAEHELVAAQLGTLAYDDTAPAPSWDDLRAGIVGAEPSVVSSAAPVVDLERRRRFRRQTRVVGAAAAVVLVAAAGVAAVHATRGSTSPTTRAISACRHQTGCSVVRLHTPAGAAPAVVLVSNGNARMLPLAMAPAPAGRQYVLWQLLRNGGPTPVATFDSISPNEVMPLSMPYADTAAFAVSVEPAGTAPLQPTKVIAVGNTTA